MGDLSASALLRLKIRLATAPLDEASHRFWSQPDLEKIFPEYLFLLHSSVRATVPLMEAARSRARALGADDPVADAIVPYLSEHIQEELHHDESLLEDMLTLGMDRSDVLARVPPTEIASLVGALYYWIRHTHPVALLGGFAVLEGYPMPPAVLDGIVERTSIPKEALRTFYTHADLDLAHRDDLDRLLDRLPLNAAQTKLLGVAAFHVIEHLTRIIRMVAEPLSIDAAHGRRQARA